MNPMSILQAARPLSPITEQVMVAVFVVIFIALILASLRAKRAPTQTAAYNARTGLIFSVILIVWGGAIWFAILTTRRYDNLLAIVAASSLLCIGLYSLVMALREKGKKGAGGAE
jgi:heme/copper-type cytochrome/quinol oxidase subunit 3